MRQQRRHLQVPGRGDDAAEVEPEPLPGGADGGAEQLRQVERHWVQFKTEHTIRWMRGVQTQQVAIPQHQKMSARPQVQALLPAIDYMGLVPTTRVKTQ